MGEQDAPPGQGGITRALRRFEKLIGIDRQGRSTWVWVFPPLVGLATGILSPLMPGIPQDFGIPGALFFAVFGFFSMTVISVLYMIAFDRDHNQQAEELERPPGFSDRH